MSLVWIFLAQSALAATLDVGPSEPFATVSDALATASDGDVIRVFAPTVTEEITVDGLSVTIVGVGLPTWEQFPTTQVATIDVVNGAVLTLGGFELDGGTGFHNGIYVGPGATLTVTRASFTGFSTAVLVDSGTATLDRVQLVGSTLTGAPQVDQLGGSVDIVASSFSDSVADYDAVVANQAGDLTVRWTRFSRLEGFLGGAVACYGTCSLEGNLFVDNASPGFGAAVMSAGDLTLVRNRVCRSDSFQGAVAVLGGTASVHNNAFIDNTGFFDGLGLAVDNAVVDVGNNTFVGNTSTYGSVASTLLLWNSDATLTNNVLSSGPDGPAALAGGGATVTSDHNLWFDNQSDTSGFSTGPSAIVGQDPLLGGGTDCRWTRVIPAPGSPVEDAGDPLILDNDGSPSDIGVTGGPDGF